MENYRLLREIGQGSFGSVWLAQQRSGSRQLYVIKLVPLSRTGVNNAIPAAAAASPVNAVPGSLPAAVSAVRKSNSSAAPVGPPHAAASPYGASPAAAFPVGPCASEPIAAVDLCAAVRPREPAFFEAHLLSSLVHPFIVRYQHSFMDGRGLHIVMEYAKGGDLHARIVERSLTHLPFEEQTILRWFVQLCIAVDFLHGRNVLHRDLKSKNIFLDCKSDAAVVKLGDFGTARALHSQADLASTSIGTPCFVSPEICRGEPYSFKSDIWALGCVLYELACLRVPFQGSCMQNVFEKITKGNYQPVHACCSKHIALLIEEMLSIDPSRRPSIKQILSLYWLQPHLQLVCHELRKQNICLSHIRAAVSEPCSNVRGSTEELRKQSSPPEETNKGEEVALPTEQVRQPRGLPPTLQVHEQLSEDPENQNGARNSGSEKGQRGSEPVTSVHKGYEENLKQWEPVQRVGQEAVDYVQQQRLLKEAESMEEQENALHLIRQQYLAERRRLEGERQQRNSDAARSCTRDVKDVDPRGGEDFRGVRVEPWGGHGSGNQSKAEQPKTKVCGKLAWRKGRRYIPELEEAFPVYKSPAARRAERATLLREAKQKSADSLPARRRKRLEDQLGLRLFLQKQRLALSSHPHAAPDILEVNALPSSPPGNGGAVAVSPRKPCASKCQNDYDGEW